MKINKITKLYDITTHTLRHYEEIGLLVPKRDSNNYRIYTKEHIEKLNIIRDLRSFDIPLSDIKDYLDSRTLDKTIELFNKGIETITKNQKELKIKRLFLEDRLKDIQQTTKIKIGEIFLKEYSEREIIVGEKLIFDPESIDYELKVLHKEHEQILKSVNQNVFGSFIDIKEDRLNYQVFYCNKYVKSRNKKYNSLPGGEYLCICYRGDYKQLYGCIKLIEDYILKNSLIKDGKYIQLYFIDFHETDLYDEYITQVEIKVNRN